MGRGPMNSDSRPRHGTTARQLDAKADARAVPRTAEWGVLRGAESSSITRSLNRNPDAGAQFRASSRPDRSTGGQREQKKGSTGDDRISGSTPSRHDRLVTGDRSPETRRQIVTEQEPVVALTEAEPSIESKVRKPAKKTTSKGAQKPAKESAAKTSAMTDEEKRLARNAALREWRKKNKDRVKAYMTEWRAKRSGKKPEELTQPSTTTPTVAATKSTSKRATSQKAKPSKVAKKAKPKKGAKA